MINLSKEEQAQYDKVAVNLTKSADQERLSEHLINLSKCVVNLSKTSNVDLGGKRARVVVALDYSGSMDDLYHNGTVQRTLDRLVPLGLTFDDNGELEVYLFSNGCKYLETLTLDNYSNYVKDVIKKSGFSMGGTEYAPVLNKILRDTKGGNKPGLFSKLFKKNTADDGAVDTDTVFVIFITDGDNFDKDDTDGVIRKSSKTNTFIQFIGIGNASFEYLKKLDNLDGRDRDNTGFSSMKSLKDTTDEVLYQEILGDFSNWLKG